jgi:hypothetical protein
MPDLFVLFLLEGLLAGAIEHWGQVYNFTVTAPAGEPRYGIQVGHDRGRAWFTGQQMRQGPCAVPRRQLRGDWPSRAAWEHPVSGLPAPAVGRIFPAQRRRTGIEPADDAERRPPVLKTGGPTRCPDASGASLPTVPGTRLAGPRPLARNVVSPWHAARRRAVTGCGTAIRRTGRRWRPRTWRARPGA